MKKKRIKNSPKEIKPALDPIPAKKSKFFLGTFITIFAFILYAQSINHGYTLDDHKVVDQNNITTQGLAGISTIIKSDYWYGSGRDELRGPIYRPTSLILYAIIWEFSPDNAKAYHFVNVFLYAITCLVLFLVLSTLFSKHNLFVPFIICILYAAHPIHTEVVNNIKSLDEILCFLFALISMWFLIRYISTKSKLTLILGGISFFLSLISKETGIAFLIIIPLTLFFFSNVSKKSNIYISIFLLGITGLWLVLRMIIFKDLPENIVTQTSALNNTLYAATDFSSKYGTAFFILLRYIGLLIFPHPLSCDYNFAQIKIISFNDVEALIGLLVYIGLGVYSIINFKKKSIVVFGILLYLISLAPVSNIFFLGGSSMAERFMYIPSLGFCIILGFYLAKLTNTDHIKWNNHTIYKFFANNSSLFIGMFAILFLYSYKIFDRNVDWKDTLTIFSRDIKVSSKSATANWILGNELLFRGSKSIIKSNQIDTFNLAKKYLNHALEIAPGLFYASSNLGFIYLVENKPDSAYLYLKGGLKTGSNNAQLNYYFGSALLLQKKYDEAIEVLNRTINLNSKYEDAYLMLAAAYLSKGDPKNGLTTYLQLIEINPNNGKVYYLAAGIYNSLGDINKAKEFMEKSISLGYQPNN